MRSVRELPITLSMTDFFFTVKVVCNVEKLADLFGGLGMDYVRNSLTPKVAGLGYFI